MANSKIPNLTLSDTLNTQRLKFNQLLDSVGDVSTLTTTGTDVTSAINEHDAELGTITSGAMGTTASTVSGAIAELDGRLDSINNTELLSPRMSLSDGAATNTVAGKLEVSDSADFASNVSVQGNLAVGGNTTMSGTLTVDGQVTFKAGSDNNISLGDAATDTITLTGEVNSNVVPDADDTYDLGSPTKEWRHVYVDGTVNADNVAADSATIANNVSIGGTLEVTGDTTLSNTITVQDSAYITGNLDVGGNLDVAGNITLGGDITIGDANTDNVAFNADINSSIIPNTDNTYDLGSASQEWRHVYVDGTVNADNVAADSATIGTLTVTGDTTLNNTITVQDSAYITGNLDIGGDVSIAGGDITTSATTFNIADTTATTINIGGSATTISVGSHNTGTTTIQHDLIVDSNLTVHGLADLDSTSITGNLIMNTNKFTVDYLGNTVIAGTLDVNDVITLDSAVITNLEVTGATTLSGATTLENSLTVQDSAYITGNTDIGGNLTVGGGFTVSGTFTTTGTTRNAASYVIVNDQVTVSPSNRAGLAVDRPSTDSAVMQWNELGDYWEAGTTTNLRQLARQDDSAAFTNLYVGGNLTVNGTTTTVNSTTVEIGDNIILLNDSLAGSGIANVVDAGIEIERGTLTNVQLLWDESEDYWVAANDGSNTLSRIATAAWLDATGPISFNSSTGNISHDDISRSDTTSTDTPSYGGTFEAVTGVTTNAQGHVTAIDVSTVTIPSSDNTNQLTVWYIEDSDGTEKTMNHNKELKVLGDYHHINTNFGSGTGTNASPYDLKISHANASGNTSSGSQTLSYGDTFTVYTGIGVDNAGHVDSSRTVQFTLPASDNTNQLTVWYIEDSDGDEKEMDHNKELKILGDYHHITTNFGSGTGTNASPYDLKISHALSSAAGATIAGSVASGGSFSAVTGVTFDNAGHVDSVQTTNFSVFSNTNTDTLQSIATDATNADQYITFVPNTTGAQTGRVDAGLTYNPSTNTLDVPNITDVNLLQADDANPMVFKNDDLNFKFQSTTVNTTSREPQLILYNTDTNITSGDIGDINFTAKNSAGTEYTFAHVKGGVSEELAGSERGSFGIWVDYDGSEFERVRMSTDVSIASPEQLFLYSDNYMYLRKGPIGYGSGQFITVDISSTTKQRFEATDQFEFYANGVMFFKSDGSDVVTSAAEGHTGGRPTFVFSDPDSANSIAIVDVALRNTDTDPVDGQTLGRVIFQGENSISNVENYAWITGTSGDITSGTEDGEIAINVLSDGATMTAFEAIGSGDTTIKSADDIFLQPTGDTVYMQGVTSGEQISFQLSTTLQQISSSDQLLVGASSGDLILYSDLGDVDLKPGSGKIGLFDVGVERAGFDVNTSDTLKIYTGANFATLNSTFSGDDLTVQGDVNSVSDVRTKQNIETVENGLDLVSQLRGVWYNKIDQEDRKVGVIAQEVEEVLPEVVHTDTEGMKSVDYGKMVGVLIEAIKELKQEIEELKSK